MTLETIIKAGNGAMVAEAFRDKFTKVMGLYAALEIAKMQGLDKSKYPKDVERWEHLQAYSADMTSARQGERLEAYLGEVFSGVVTEVQSDVREAIDGIGGKTLRQYLMSKKPFSLPFGLTDVIKAHKDAYNAQQILTDENALNEVANKYNEDLINGAKSNSLKGSIAWVLRNNLNIAKSAVQTDAINKIRAFDALEDDLLRGYAMAGYDATKDKDRPAEAYGLGIAVAQYSVEKEKERAKKKAA